MYQLLVGLLVFLLLLFHALYIFSKKTYVFKSGQYISAEIIFGFIFRFGLIFGYVVYAYCHFGLVNLIGTKSMSKTHIEEDTTVFLIIRMQ